MKQTFSRSSFVFSLLSAALLAGCSGGPGNKTAALSRVGDFSLLDQQGYFHQMSYYDDHKAIALLVQSNSNTEMVPAVNAYKASQAKHQGKIKFFMLNPIGLQAGTEKRDSVQEQVKLYDTKIPVLMDDTQLISEAMGVDKIGEVFLLDPKTFTVLYRGPVDAHFESAVDAVLTSKPIALAQVKTKGPAVKYIAKTATAGSKLSYAKDIAPILADNCARCHREGGIGPFAMTSHSVIKGFAPMIREVLLTKRMPPGQIDPLVGHFKNTYTLTPDQTQKLIHWIEAGAKQDGTVDPLAQLQWPASKWALGDPDLVIKVPPQTIPATGVLDYIRVTVPIDGMDRPRYVRASQYIAGDRTVLHHTLNDLIPPNASGARSMLGRSDPNAARITAYIPGAQVQVEPPNTGGLLKPGSSLALQLHYTTNGKATTDNSEIGLWFYPDNQEPAERMSGQCACIFTNTWKHIPPYAADYEMEQTITIPKAAHIYSMLPHMHFRGKRMRFYAEYPDGRKQELLNIAKYNYNWQLNYELVEPLLVPAGTKVRAIAAFDNSTQNKANPDASRKVPWGLQSWDEMFFGSVTYKFVDQSGAKLSSTTEGAAAH